MAQERLSMRKIKEVLRLTAAGLSRREVSRATGVSLGAVNSYVHRARALGLEGSKAEGFEEEELFAQLFPDKDRTRARSSESRPEPDWRYVHAELRRKHVTRQLLFEEYREAHPDGYARTQFFEGYRRWRSKLPVWMRQTHHGGEKVFVDFSGDGIPWIDPQSGERRVAALFVSALGASQLIFARATHHERLADWLEGIEGAFKYYGGTTDVIVPDQARAVVKKSSRYDPEIQETFADFARHYSSCVIPARPRKPRDKAKAENAVLIVQRWIIARLRNHAFSSIAEINTAIAELLEDVNARKIRRLGVSRLELFEHVDRPALSALPSKRFEYADWKMKVLVGLDYHVEYAEHHYSVPYRLARQRVDLRVSANTVEVFRRHERLASHVRTDGPGRTTLREHMPDSHRRHDERSPADLIDEAARIGLATRELVEAILADRPHPEQGYRACVGLLSLARRYSQDRFEAACLRALLTRNLRYQAVDSILKCGLEKEPLPEELTLAAAEQPAPHHENLRGAAYYN